MQEPADPQIPEFGSIFRFSRDAHYQADRLEKFTTFMVRLLESYVRQLQHEQHRGRQVWNSVLWVKEQLENVRRDLDLEREVTTALRNHIEEFQKAKQYLLLELEKTQQGIQERQAAVDRLSAQLAGFQEQLAARVDELEKARQNERYLEVRLIEQQHEAVRLREELHTIWNSTGWAVLQKMYAVRFLVFPRGSRRERIARVCMHLMRTIRHQGATAAFRVFAQGLRHGFVFDAEVAPVTKPVPREITVEAAGVMQADGISDLVSVILPVYSQADLLRDAIESVLAQTYPHFELIVLNYGSRDDVLGVLQDYVDHPKVRVLTQINQKLPKALSNAFEFASGEFWTWTSADNLMGPEHLAREVAFLKAHPEVEMVYADYLAIDDRGQPLQDPTWRAHNRHRPDSPEIHLPCDPEPLNRV